MGVDIHIKIVGFNHDTRYFEELKLYRTPKVGVYEDVDLFPGRNSEMFGAMANEEIDIYGLLPTTDIRMSSLDPMLRGEIDTIEYNRDGYGFSEISLEAFRRYLAEHKKIIIIEDDTDKKEWVENPLNSLFKDVTTFIFFAEGWWVDDYSDYKMIFWFDC